MPIDLLNFVRKWNASTLTERSAAPQHFRDLCEALGVPHPTEVDEIGASYTFEKRVRKVGSTEEGFADVWKRGWFAWEYKSKGGDLAKAYRQLNQYHEALENPPLLIVCDFVRFEVHTKFENSPSRVYAFSLDDLLDARDTATSALPPLEVLRHVFGDYNQLRPKLTAARVTEAAAADFLRLAERIELEKAISPQPSREQIAHFLMRLVFCLFADSVGLLPNHTFRRLVETDRHSPISFNRKLPDLFAAMSFDHGYFGVENIPHFNGGLFSDNSTIPLDNADLGILHSATQHDWSHVEPAIFGTLFERSLDAAKRSMIGAHYTSADDILLIIEPVIVAPLERRWQIVRQSVLDALAEEETALAGEETSAEGAAHNSLGRPQGGPGKTPEKRPRAESPAHPASLAIQTARARASHRTQPTLGLNRPALLLLQDWAAELSRIRVLDPACGSGNFLYLALKRILDLWHQARTFGIAHGLTLALDPIPHPGQLFGIETDFYAHEIASVVVWIGFLQWKRDHGVEDHKTPILQKLTNIEEGDAILRYDKSQTSEAHPNGKPYEPSWPPADFIIGNPPFLGDKKMRGELGDKYVDDLRSLYAGRVPGGADLVTYWFEKARAMINEGSLDRAGLLATQGIRGGANREVLERIKESGDIFWAHADRPWLLDGAMVHVSMVGFDSGVQVERELNGEPTESIHANLTCGVDSTAAIVLTENENLCFIGTQKGGPFNISQDVARRLINAPVNPNGKSNKEVIHPWANASDITGRPRCMSVIDFGVNMSKNDASLFELPFEYVKKKVLPKREKFWKDGVEDRWWLHQRTRPAFRDALAAKARYLATPRHSKFRFFVWLDSATVPDSALAVVARDDEYMLGILSSRAHEIWARAQGTQVRDVESGFRYTPESCFDTFPFPWPPGKEDQSGPLVQAIATAASELVRQRDEWLNPPGADEDELKQRTLTKLYNRRAAGEMTWLDNAHRTLDAAVFAAYGWPADLSRDEILSRLLDLNRARAAVV